MSETIPSIIERVSARKVLDSRGNWGIEVDVSTPCGFGRCAAPSGASTGKFEAVSYPGGSVDEAVSKVREVVAPGLVGMRAEEQEEVDSTLRELDGTDNFSSIGGNTAVAVSLAVVKAAASSKGVPVFRYLGRDSVAMPYPLGNVIGGGAHASNATDIQEFLVIPVGASNVLEALNANTTVHRRVKEMLLARGKAAGLGKGDEGAWAPRIGDDEALEVLSAASAEVGDELGVETRLGVDVAASEMWDGKRYVYRRKGVKRTREDQVGYILELIERHDIYYVEDPLEEEDFEGFAEITAGSKALVCGDDLYVTNIKRIGEGIKAGSSRAVLIKPNQIGTLTDTFKAIDLANRNRLAAVFSHRSGETVDETIAHLAVAAKCPIIKTGVVGGERIAKLNELIRIEELDKDARMASLPLIGGSE